MAMSTTDRLTEVLERWEAVIGLEIHTELTSLNTKMFCGCPVAFGGEPNTRVCPVCLGLPGALPVPNDAAIQATVLAGLALECGISRRSQFHRKNYFYPDMPKDFQISQYDLPFCLEGHVDVEVEGEGAKERVHREGTSPLAPDAEDDAYVTRIGITRIHLEEDTGKMVHVGGSEGRLAGATHSLVDFNRAGTPLIELVTEPDIRTPEEARRFAQKLRLTWLSLGISDCNMEEGSLRVDANVSVRKRGDDRVRHQGRSQEHELVQGTARRARLRDRAAGRGASSRAVASCRRLGTGTWGPSAPARFAPRKRRTTTATSPSPTWCPSSSPTPTSRASSSGCPSYPTQSASDSSPTTDCRCTTPPS